MRKNTQKAFDAINIEGLFFADLLYISVEQTIIAYDKENALIGIKKNNSPSLYFNGKNIINSEIILEEEKYERHSLLNMWRRYFIGKMIGGAKIAEIGAKTAKVKISSRITQIKLKLTVNQPDYPILNITFMKGQHGKSSIQKCLQDVEHWKGLIDLLQFNNRL